MSDDDSDNRIIAIVVIVVLDIIAGIVFLANKTLWPELQNPALRCLVAPVIGIAAFAFYYLVYVGLPQAALMILWKVFLWLTTPRFVLAICGLIVIGTGVALLFKWIAAPVALYWTIIAGAAVGTAGGFIAARLSRLLKSDSWIVQTVIALPVAIGLTYLAFNLLYPGFELALMILPIPILLVFLIRFLVDEHQNRKKAAEKYEPINPSSLSRELKDLVLKQVKDQLGSTKYNQLVSAVGEDALITQVLANMQKK
jgi:hypothetical protein